MTTQLAEFEITSLALQYCDLDPASQLTAEDRQRVAQTEKFIQLYLMRTDIERRYTLQQQADAIGVSLATVKRYVKTDDFAKVAAYMAPPQRSPVMVTAKEFLTDELVPLALRRAKEILENDGARESTQANLIINLMKMALNQDSAEGNTELQRRDAMAFLKDQGIQAGQINVTVNHNYAPAEYAEALEEAIDVEPVELED